MDAKNTVIAAVGTIIYRWDNKRLQVLVGTRKKNPWKGLLVALFSGTVERQDETIVVAAQREAMQETGGTLYIEHPHFLNHYGPKAQHGFITKTPLGVYFVETEVKEPDPNLFLFSAFYAEYKTGYPSDNLEIDNLRFEYVSTLLADDTEFAFDQSLVLLDFYKVAENGLYAP